MNAADLSRRDAPGAQTDRAAFELTETPTLLSAPPGPASRGAGLYRIRAEARTDAGSLFIREAVIALRGRSGNPAYDVRLWPRADRP